MFKIIRDWAARVIGELYPFPIIDNLPDDICEYLHITKPDFLNMIKTGMFRSTYDGYQNDYEKWLQESVYYFYDLCEWHVRTKARFIIRSIFQPSRKDILDFGSGLGTRALIYAKKNRVTLVEINGKTLDFSRWRFNKYHRDGDFYTKLPSHKEYDVVLLIDVIGHLVEPYVTICDLCNVIKEDGILKVTFDLFQDTDERGIHRNSEIDFDRLFVQNGMSRIDSITYRKRKAACRTTPQISPPPSS